MKVVRVEKSSTHTHIYTIYIFRVYAYAVVAGQLWVSSVSKSLLFTLHYIHTYMPFYIVNTRTVTNTKHCF